MIRMFLIISAPFALAAFAQHYGEPFWAAFSLGVGTANLITWVTIARIIFDANERAR